jgi:hypothetical protein
VSRTASRSRRTATSVIAEERRKYAPTHAASAGAAAGYFAGQNWPMSATAMLRGAGGGWRGEGGRESGRERGRERSRARAFSASQIREAKYYKNTTHESRPSAILASA